MKAKRLLWLVMVICLASGVKAQIYNSEVLFYVEESASLTDPQTYVNVYRFKSGECYNATNRKYGNLKNICDRLKSDINYYENHSNLWQRWTDVGHFDSEMSNSKWNVFSHQFDKLYDSLYGGGLEWPDHTLYYAFQKDFSQLMIWKEPEYDNRWGHQGERRTYKRLTKSELLKLSFTGARDFLQ